MKTERYHINRLDWIQIEDGAGKTTFGPDQEWFPDEFPRISGCGPTSGALITAYLARTRPDRFGALYPELSFARPDFVRHMQTMFQYLRPGPMGLNSLAMYRDGMASYCADRGVALTPLLFQVNGVDYGRRGDGEALRAFLRDALAEDHPVAFLALSRGAERNLQNWHWITIVEAEFRDDALIATASDEGIARSFDLLKWYRTTRLSGGLIRFH